MIRAIYIFILFQVGLSAFGQINIGYVDYDKVVQTLPEYSAAQHQIELKAKLFQVNLDRKVSDLQKFLASIKKHPDSTEIAIINDNLNTFSIQIEDYQNHAQKELKEAQDSSELALKEYVSQELKKFCSAKNVNCTMEINEFLPCKSYADFTEDFIEYLGLNYFKIHSPNK